MNRLWVGVWGLVMLVCVGINYNAVAQANVLDGNLYSNGIVIIEGSTNN